MRSLRLLILSETSFGDKMLRAPPTGGPGGRPSMRTVSWWTAQTMTEQSRCSGAGAGDRRSAPGPTEGAAEAPAGLQPGRLKQGDEPARAKTQALRFLAARDRSISETRERLLRSGFSDEVVSQTLDRLMDLGYLDDERLARRCVTQKLRAGWSEARVRGELLRRGISRSLAEDAISSGIADSDAVSAGEDALVSLALRKFGGEFAVDSVAATNRLAGFLARRGHDWETTQRVARVVRDEVAHSASAGGRPSEDGSGDN